MTIFEKAIKWLQKIFQTLLFQVEETVFPFVIDFLNNAKKLIDNPAIDAWLEFIPASIEKEKFEKLKDSISLALTAINKKHDISKLNSPANLNEALNDIFLDIHLKSKQERGEFFSTIGAKLLQGLAQNQMNFATAVMQLEYYYKKIYRGDED